jgi:hypothetical protein
MHLNLLAGKHHGKGTLETVTKGPFVRPSKSTVHVTATLNMNHVNGNRPDVDVISTQGTLTLESATSHQLVHLVLAPDFKDKRHDRGIIEVGLRVPILRGASYYASWLEHLPVVRDNRANWLHIDAQNFTMDSSGGRLMALRHFVLTITPENIRIRIVTFFPARNPYEEGDVTQTLVLDLNPAG